MFRISRSKDVRGEVVEIVTVNDSPTYVVKFKDYLEADYIWDEDEKKLLPL